MIKKITFTNNNMMKDITLPDKRIIQVQGSDANVFISLIERIVATDFSDFYDNYDAQFGIEGTNFKQVTAHFSFGDFIYKNDVINERYNTSRALHCVRYVGGKNIRSTFSNTDEKPSTLGVSLTEFTSAINKASWLRLEMLINYVIGDTFFKVDYNNAKITFDFEKTADFSKDLAKIMYLIVSECFVSISSGQRFVCLSKIEGIIDEQMERLLYSLVRISNIDTVFFVNDISADAKKRLNAGSITI